MRILLLAYDLGLQGGVGSFNYELSSALASMGHEVYVVARNVATSLCPPSVKAFGFRTFKIPPKDVLFYLWNRRAIANLSEKLRPDVIHDSSSALGLIPELSHYAPVVQTVHGSPLLGHLRRIYDSIEDRVRAKLFELSHRLPALFFQLFNNPRIEKLVFVSRSCLADALVHMKSNNERERLLSKSYVIYNGLSVKRIRALSRGIDNDPYAIVFSGRLMEYKGPHRLLRALPLIAKEVPEVRLHIVGSGPLFGYIRKLSIDIGLRDRVILHGWIERDRALRILASSSILVHPSLYESFCYSIAEAYALGKPVIAHRAPYSKELVEDMGAGLTVNTFDARTLANAVIALLTDKNLYRRLSERALKVAEEYFDIDVVAKQYVKVYEEAIEDRR